MINPDIVLEIHPAIKDELESDESPINVITEEDITRFIVIAGLPGWVIRGVINGRIKPENVIRNRIERIFSQDTVNRLITEYDPYRGIEILEGEPDRRFYDIYEKYPVSMIKARDCLLSDQDTWIRISSLKNEEKSTMVTVFSGGTEMGKLRMSDHAIVAVFSGKKKTLDSKTRNRIATDMSKRLAKDIFTSQDDSRRELAQLIAERIKSATKD